MRIAEAIALFLPLLASSPGEGRATEDPQAGLQSTYLCGVNSAYLMLKLHGIDADYRQIGAQMPIKEHGSSLADLRRVIVASGLDVGGYQCSSLRDLAAFQKPFIVHTRQRNNPGGHYIVVLDEGERGFRYLDGTFPLYGGWASPEHLEAMWTGYVVAKTVDTSHWLIGASGVILAMCILTALWIPKQGRRIHPPASR
jgi:hypothetical protein